MEGLARCTNDPPLSVLQICTDGWMKWATVNSWLIAIEMDSFVSCEPLCWAGIAHMDDDADGGGGETVKFVGSGQISIKTKVNS